MNIFQIYKSVGDKVPFVVISDQWANEYGLNYGVCVSRVELSEKFSEEKPYGKAYGYSLTPLNGNKNTFPYGRTLKQISCAGCYKWELVNDVPEKWIDEIFTHAIKNRLNIVGIKEILRGYSVATQPPRAVDAATAADKADKQK